MTGLNVSDGVRVAAAANPARVAIVDGKRSLSFGSLIDRSDRVTNGARGGLGLVANARVGVLAPHCLEFVELVLGLANARMRPVLFNSRLSARELAQICEDLDVGVAFVHPSLRGLAESIETLVPIRIMQLGAEYDDWLATASSASPSHRLTGDEVFCIAPTGGTTGRSKGVRLSQKSRVLMYLMMGSVFGCYSAEDRNLTVAPLFHGSGFNFCFATLFYGGSVILAGEFDPETMLDLLVTHRVTNASVVPTHLSALLGLGEPRLRAADMRAMRALISNGAPLPISMKELGDELWEGRVLFEAYGGTEAGIISTMSPAHLLRRPESVGRVFPLTFAELRGVDGARVDAGQMGELFTRSPYLFSGYEDGLAAAPYQDWFSAGDLGRFDDEGFLYLVDRKDEKIISGGVNIYPSEVELALADHPAVGDVAVFGIPDAYWGEAVHAMIALKPGASVAIEELLIHSRTRLGRMKTPKSIELRPHLPKSAAGKVLRRVLRDEYRARATAGITSADTAITPTGSSAVDQK